MRNGFLHNMKENTYIIKIINHIFIVDVNQGELKLISLTTQKVCLMLRFIQNY